MMRRWIIAILFLPAFATAVYFWLSSGLPTPLWMRPFREDHFLIFKALGIIVAPAYYLILFKFWQAKQATDWIKKTHRLAEPHEYERETVLQMLLSPMFRHWAKWMIIFATGLILLGSVMYFEGVNEGVTYANQTIEQTGGWGMLDVLGWGVSIGLIAAFLITNRYRNLPQYVPMDAPRHADPKPDYRDYMKAGKSDEKPKDDAPPPLPDDVKNALELLDLSIPYDLDTLKKRRKQLLAKTHPDAGGSAALFRQVENAYQVLKDNL